VNANLEGITAVVNSLFMVLGEILQFAKAAMLDVLVILPLAEVVS